MVDNPLLIYLSFVRPKMDKLQLILSTFRLCRMLGISRLGASGSGDADAF